LCSSIETIATVVATLFIPYIIVPLLDGVEIRLANAVCQI